MITSYFKTVRDKDFKKIEDFRAGCWVYITDVTFQDLEKVSELTRLSLDDIKDSVDKYEIPRIEHLDESVITFTRHPSDQEVGLYTSTLTIILTNIHVITISPTKSDIIEEILHSKNSLATTQKGKLLFHILLRITNNFTNKIKSVRNSIIEYSQKLKTVDNKAIIMLTKNEDILSQYLTSLVPMRNLLDTISSGRYVNLFENDLNLLQDLLIAIKQSEDLCRVNIKSIQSLRDSYQILFTNDVNKTIKRLTAITIIFTVPTIIASIFGMNVVLPFGNFKYAFYIILSMILLLSMFLLWIFAKKKWL